MQINKFESNKIRDSQKEEKRSICNCCIVKRMKWDLPHIFDLQNCIRKVNETKVEIEKCFVELENENTVIQTNNNNPPL